LKPLLKPPPPFLPMKRSQLNEPQANTEVLEMGYQEFNAREIWKDAILMTGFSLAAGVVILALLALAH